MRNIGSAAVTANNALRSVRPGANEAQNALLNLNRIVQDSPYGFIDVAYNISPALESFQRLRASTGSTGTALKALAMGLIGGGGWVWPCLLSPQE
jgi:hypothetical protein